MGIKDLNVASLANLFTAAHNGRVFEYLAVEDGTGGVDLFAERAVTRGFRTSQGFGCGPFDEDAHLWFSAGVEHFIPVAGITEVTESSLTFRRT